LKAAGSPSFEGVSHRTAVILGISLLSGVVSYGFNLLIDAFYGPQVLAQVLAALGAGATIGLPAALVSLPVATWSGQAPLWRRRLPLVQGAFLAAGLVSALGVLFLRGRFPGAWLAPIGLLVALSSYLPAVATGVLIGRAAFVGSAVVTMLPNLGRLLGILAVGHRPAGGLTVLWVQVVSFAAFGVYGIVLPYRTPSPEAVRPVKATPWASGWVALAVTAWLSVDILVATLHLGAARAAGFAVVALLGKAPFYLAQPLVLMAIGEEGWGRSKRREGSLAVAAIAAVSVLLGFVFGSFAMRLMGVREPAWLLAAYFLGTCALGLGYLWSGADAQREMHHWWPLLAVCVAWAVWSLVWGGGPSSLVAGYVVAQTLGAAAVVVLGLRAAARARGGRESRGAMAN
jgi:hypothetical protein